MLMPKSVEVLPYDPEWPARFEREAARIRAAVGDRPLRLDHIGSTAVPGLDAKPIVDILGGRPPGSDLAPYVAALEGLGWIHRGENGIAGRAFFRLGFPGRTHHLHLFEEGHPAWRDHLRFRDTLRARAGLRDAYGALKRDLARRFPTDRPAYIDAKAPFVEAVLRVAGTDAPAPGPRVRAKAVCAIVRGGDVLVGEAFDAVKGTMFYGPPGGGVEFGERAEEAVRRELREEIGAELEDVRLLGVVESVFVYQGRPEHEIVFCFGARLADASLYARDAIVGTEGGREYVVRWRPLAWFASGERELFPAGLYAMLAG